MIPFARSALEQGAVPELLAEVLVALLDDIDEFAARAKDIEKRLERLARDIPEAQNLMSVPGIGLLSATALVAFVGDIQRFPSRRSCADYLGLTPREHSPGPVRRLGRITKRGNTYLRMLLVHGARSALRAGMMMDEPDDLRAWALGVKNRKGFNLAAVAIANKLARVAWERLEVALVKAKLLTELAEYFLGWYELSLTTLDSFDLTPQVPTHRIALVG